MKRLLAVFATLAATACLSMSPASADTRSAECTTNLGAGTFRAAVSVDVYSLDSNRWMNSTPRYRLGVHNMKGTNSADVNLKLYQYGTSGPLMNLTVQNKPTDGVLRAFGAQSAATRKGGTRLSVTGYYPWAPPCQGTSYTY